MKAGMIKRFKAEHQHIVKVNSGGCWTFMITGPERRKWGFWVTNKKGRKKFRKRNKYFFEHNIHQCDNKIQ